jgi:hypothetical protein
MARAKLGYESLLVFQSVGCFLVLNFNVDFFRDIAIGLLLALLCSNPPENFSAVMDKPVANLYYSAEGSGNSLQSQN